MQTQGVFILLVVLLMVAAFTAGHQLGWDEGVMSAERRLYSIEMDAFVRGGKIKRAEVLRAIEQERLEQESGSHADRGTRVHPVQNGTGQHRFSH